MPNASGSQSSANSAVIPKTPLLPHSFSAQPAATPPQKAPRNWQVAYVPNAAPLRSAGAIFDTSADLRWLEKGELQVLTVPDWLDRVRKRPSAKAEGKPREDFIVTIDRSDDQTAFIKVRCQLPPRYFTDYLVAMKLRDGWKIVSKSYRYDLRE